jgi:long-chain fatty acid transport protein
MNWATTFHRLLATGFFLFTFHLSPFTSAVWAGPFDDFGVGSRDAAMGGAYTAIADDFSGAYYNPGALSLIKESSFGFGFTYTHPRLYLNSQESRIENVTGTPFGFIVPLRGIFKEKAAIGFSGFMLGSLIYDVAMPPLNQPDFALDRHRLRQQILMFAASAQIFPFLSVGAGAQVQASIPSSVSMYLDAPFLLSGQPTPGAPPSGYDFGVDVAYIITPTAGLLIKFSPRFKIGFTFRDSLDMRIKLKSSEIASGLSASPQTLDIMVASHILYTPRQYVLGTAVDILPDLTAAFDLIRTDWSGFPNPSAHISLSSPDPVLNQVLPSVPPPPDPNFSDTLSQRFGIEYRLNLIPKIKTAIRAGYGWSPSPIPDQTGESNFLDSDRHTFSGGLGIAFPAPWSLVAKPIEANFHLRYQLLAKRRVVKLGTVPADNPGQPGYTIDGDIFSGGLSLNLSF